MFTACPAVSRPSVVTASVCGINITSKLVLAQRGHGEAHAVDRHRPLRDQQRLQLGLGSTIRTRAVDSTRVSASTVPTPSTWPEDEVPAERPAEPQGSLQVHEVARRQSCKATSG